MSCLIVGCGYLGRRVGSRLAGRGETVLGTTRTQARADELRQLGIQPVRFDVLSPSSIDPLPAVDRLFYCVGFDRGAGHAMREVYVDGLIRTLERLPSLPAQFVYASATSVYGSGNDGWVDEETPAEPITESGRICLAAERAAAERCPGVVILRYSGLYGPGRILRRSALERGEPIVGDPRGMLNLIHVDDAASAAIAALDKAAAGSLYVATDDRPVTRRELYGLTAQLLDAPPPRFLDPKPGSPEATRAEAAKRLSNRRIKAELGLEWRHPDISSGLPAALEGA